MHSQITPLPVPPRGQPIGVVDRDTGGDQQPRARRAADTLTDHQTRIAA